MDNKNNITKSSCSCCSDCDIPHDIKEENSASGCSCGPDCCDASKDTNAEKGRIVIDFLYLDLSVCARCQGTDISLDEALVEVSKVLEATGVEVEVNKIKVTTEELAIKHMFVSSPTIRVNGRDIQMEVKESLCESCGDLCGDEVDCRVWVYQGKDYIVPPKAMIIEAILKEVYGGVGGSNIENQEYVLPENLRNFYAVMKGKEQKRETSCCESFFRSVKLLLISRT